VFPRRPQFWRFRETDLVAVLDGLDHIEHQAPMIRGRLDRSRIAVAGHSWGGQTASTLLGATHPDPDDGSVVDRKDARIKPSSGGGSTWKAWMLAASSDATTDM
jgi:pimeloyl-ACP methyl ester carboxylesterase